MKKTININEASGDQLRIFAENHLGMTFASNAKVESMRAKVLAAWNKDTIELPDDEDYDDPVRQEPPARTKRAKADEFIVFIEQQETFDGREPVPLGCNGVQILVPRGEWCAVPIQFFDSLVNAIEDRRDPLPDGGLGPVYHVHRYPHRLWQGQGEPEEGVRRPPARRQQTRAA